MKKIEDIVSSLKASTQAKALMEVSVLNYALGMVRKAA
jgi:hypothetical protein